mmetsp:Transcript_22246/g.74843  ORF Transcript_22246/g.74843 Transcript_22246/m.74843 type:complete len:246 (+) Transcript_22246:1709-2446(+)
MARGVTVSDAESLESHSFCRGSSLSRTVTRRVTRVSTGARAESQHVALSPRHVASLLRVSARSCNLGSKPRRRAGPRPLSAACHHIRIVNRTLMARQGIPTPSHRGRGPRASGSGVVLDPELAWQGHQGEAVGRLLVHKPPPEAVLLAHGRHGEAPRLLSHLDGVDEPGHRDCPHVLQGVALRVRPPEAQVAVVGPGQEEVRVPSHAQGGHPVAEVRAAPAPVRALCGGHGLLAVGAPQAQGPVL